MKNIYRGFHPTIISEFICGKSIWFRKDESEEWLLVAPYKYPNDVYRLSNDIYEFTTKPQTTVANIFVQIYSNNNVYATDDQSPYCDNTKVTFNENGVPIKAEVL